MKALLSFTLLSIANAGSWSRAVLYDNPEDYVVAIVVLHFYIFALTVFAAEAIHVRKRR